MFQIRIHGRGGQGVVTAAELIAIAAFYDGKISQAFPSFGVERTGAPIESYARIDDQPIRTREQVNSPDIIIVQDSSLLDVIDVSRGANENTVAIINSANQTKDLNIKIAAAQVYIIDATEIALKKIGQNIVNTTILGAFAKSTGLVSLEGLKQAIREKFGDKGKDVVQKNIAAIEEAYKLAGSL